MSNKIRKRRRRDLERWRERQNLEPITEQRIVLWLESMLLHMTAVFSTALNEWAAACARLGEKLAVQPNQFKCAQCGEVFDKERSDEEAMEESREA